MPVAKMPNVCPICREATRTLAFISLQLNFHERQQQIAKVIELFLGLYKSFIEYRYTLVSIQSMVAINLTVVTVKVRELGCEQQVVRVEIKASFK